ncbi:MAG: glycosyltransferase [Ignavibacteriae bacterium]|nr:MAG: glycosyltransferase [Ignavibacteriota bacterium]
MKVLLLADSLGTVDGVTTHLYNLIKGLSVYNELELYLICGENNTDKLNPLNIEIITDKLFLHKNRSYINYLQAVSYLKKFTDNYKIDIIHSHTHYAANIAKRAVKNDKVTIQTNHGLLKDEGRLKHFCADKYVAINEHIYEHLLQNNIAEKSNIYFIRCGIEVPEEPVKKNTGIIKFFAASRLTQDKGLDIFIKAVSKLSREDKAKAEFYIAGDGPEELNLKNLNNDLKAGIVFAGKIEDMKNILTDSHAFVFSGRSDTEGFPASITEAAAYNNLVITSSFFGVDSVVKDKTDGFVFAMEDDNALANILSDVINNYTKYIFIANNFYKKVKNMYDLKTMAEKHYNMYKGCQPE